MPSKMCFKKMSEMLELVPGSYLTAFLIKNHFLNIQPNGSLVISQQAVVHNPAVI
jgi:hypothetical protein